MSKASLTDDARPCRVACGATHQAINVTLMPNSSEFGNGVSREDELSGSGRFDDAVQHGDQRSPVVVFHRRT